MTAEEREVIAAAERWHDSDRGAESLPGHSYPGDELFKAVNALRASRTPKPRFEVVCIADHGWIIQGSSSRMIYDDAKAACHLLNEDEERRK